MFYVNNEIKKHTHTKQIQTQTHTIQTLNPNKKTRQTQIQTQTHTIQTQTHTIPSWLITPQEPKELHISTLQHIVDVDLL